MPPAFMRAMFRPEFVWPMLFEAETYLGNRRLPLLRGKVLGGLTHWMYATHTRCAAAEGALTRRIGITDLV